jgi:hypothetical protein
MWCVQADTNARRLLLLLAGSAAPVFAHMMSMSTGEIQINGTRARYELRMPVYEVMHVQNPDRALLDSMQFSSRGQAAKQTSGSCREEIGQGAYVCTAEYEFPAPVDRLEVECRYPSVTVPNHVHLLHAMRDGKRDQAMFDLSFPKATIRFDPPTTLEIVSTQFGAGLWRAAGGLAQVLFLVCLVLAARSRKELLALAAMFFLGQGMAVFLTPLVNWQPAPRFVEAAAALTIAYLAVEILLLPKAGQRWMIAFVLGGFHGLYFEVFVRATEYQALYVIAGALAGEIILLAVFAFLMARLGRVVELRRPVQVSASLLLVIGMTWFFLRLRG